MNNAARLAPRLVGALALLAAPLPALAIPMSDIVVANRASGNISVIDAATSTVQNVPLPASMAMPAPLYAIYSPTNKVVFVGERANGRVAAFAPRDYSVINLSIPTVSVYAIDTPNGVPVFLSQVTTGLNPFGLATVPTIPEPMSLWLLLAGGVLMVAVGARRKRRP